MTYQAYRYPVSVKGVVIRDGHVLLLRNERDEWELPGGKLEPGEDPAACVTREIAEESGWPVTAGPLLDAWQYHVGDGKEVLILAYGCFPDDGAAADPVVSHEHSAARLFTAAEIPGLTMPAGYKKSIMDWYARLAC